MHEFSVNHMRTINSHNTLSAQSDQPHCCLLLKYLCHLYFFFLSVLVLRPVCISAFWEYLTEIYGTQTAMVQVRPAMCSLARTFAVRSS